MPTYEIFNSKTNNYVGPFRNLDEVGDYARSLPASALGGLSVEYEQDDGTYALALTGEELRNRLESNVELPIVAVGAAAAPRRTVTLATDAASRASWEALDEIDIASEHGFDEGPHKLLALGLHASPHRVIESVLEADRLAMDNVDSSKR